ncbi:hypothetical protein [Acinetobacter indicus]|uniref:Lipoprotein n=1 Tax=Acinetobacter indicus TaxID=756892 RepID=A0A6C0Y7D7_9GAMM|nr:hypothetical protein [Acinetobacter indicus]QIC72177.1 hypothetical protein FSC09_17625 [Acinetobacter indicus]RVT32633.1 hypothetical protein ENC20_10830 [Acinetobacter indicus]
MKNFKVLPLLFASLFVGCGTVGNMVIQDQTLEQKAAFALNTTSDKVAISNRQGSIDGTINFVATVGKKSHQCYITTVGGAISSQAVCSGSNSVKQSSDNQCNALLKAAGRC